MASREPKGLLTPFRRDRKRDFATGSGDDLLASKVRQVLMTEGSTERTTGELPWRTSFGAGLHLLRHQSNDAVLAALGRVYIRDAMALWLPEVGLISVSVERVDAELHVRVRYRAAHRGQRGASAVEWTIHP